MGEQFFLSLQQNIKLFFWLPILCAIFRAAFIVGYHPYQKLDDKWAIIRKCFSFGFWFKLCYDSTMMSGLWKWITVNAVVSRVISASTGCNGLRGWFPAGSVVPWDSKKTNLYFNGVCRLLFSSIPKGWWNIGRQPGMKVEFLQYFLRKITWDL